MGKIHVITAAAGAGKTTKIVSDVAKDVETRAPEEILGTTFTIKSADELVQRTRTELFKQGRADAAVRMLGARFGTVNAVCGQIVAEHALELGRSPAISILDETNAALVFHVAADGAIGRYASSLNGLGEAFGSEDSYPRGMEPPDWRKTVRNILAKARANGLGTEGLTRSALRSLETYVALLPAPAGDEAALDTALADAVSAAVSKAPATISTTGKGSLTNLRLAHVRLSRGERLPWSAWASLSKVKCAPTKDGRDYDAALSAVAAAAGQHAGHPRLRADAERFIQEIFACAGDALSAYQTYKAERGLLDFVDQEALALEVLNNPAWSERLRERIGRVFVDEFQDCSPLQVAVFTTLAGIAEASTWVGDPKQAIYGFRGADTELTQAAFAGAAAAADGPGDVLKKSYRSRKRIVEFVNEAFTPALERMGLPLEDHLFSESARSEDGFDREPLACWPLAGKVEEQAAALADGLRRVLDEAKAWPVEDRDGGHRPLKPGDIAVLCRTNTDMSRIAKAISRAGLSVAVERSGLARTPHVEIVLAAYRWVADPSDRLALAELARFFAEDPHDGAWLEAASAEDADAVLKALVPISGDLERLRGQLLNLTPAELLDAVMTSPELMAVVEAWGDPAIRFEDLEALRGFSRAYEGECAAGAVPATPAGLLLALADADPARPPSLAEDAVKVMTYHGAKGLEWPLVVLASLGWEPGPRLFEPVAEADGELDWCSPLSNRWIRYWPWPYGLSGEGSTLDVNAAASDFGQRAHRRAIEEDTRLLYVGMTRARDYLVLAPPAVRSATWLKVLDRSDADVQIVLPSPGDNLIRVGREAFPADVRLLQSPGEEEVRPIVVTHVSARVRGEAPAPLYVTPSQASAAGQWRVAERIRLGERLSIDGVSDITALGEALHAVLACDDINRPVDARVSDAEAILQRWGVKGLAPRDAIAASDRLSTVLNTRWPDAFIRREAPISATLGEHVVRGRIDLLAEHGAGYAIIDHKSFPGRHDKWDERAVSYAPQLGLYAHAVEAVAGKPCKELFIHMPIVGILLRLERA